jgi:BirA family biotin operon repressor/biotin-[acetyl-CoA-carboxylase] ligase
VEAPAWIIAAEQSQGRGRNGRRWQSPKGNLYATLALRPAISASAATQLSFVAALGAYDAIASQLPARQSAALRLKWPNDVLLGGAKIAGILIESVTAPAGLGVAMAIGIGVNVAFAPADTGQATAALGLPPAGCAAVFEALAGAFQNWLACWDQGLGFPAIREAWLARAHVRGESLNVRLNGATISGRFRGLDERGALQLETEAGVVISVNAGDISPAAPGPAN